MAEKSRERDAGTFGGLVRGSRVASYRLESQVGAGGMAVVFQARDERLGRRVALKVMAPALAGDPGFRQRFIRESRAAAAVDDPHIIPVYEAGEADGVLFIAMRLVAGGDLRSVAARDRPLSADRAAGFISAAASALDAAHAAGLVHRDVKPANMLVDSRPGQPDHLYLSDFGLSKGASSASLTGSAEVFGTPDYCSPEQASGAAVDGRADQYALACVAFSLLTGVPVFERDHPVAVLMAHLSQPPRSLVPLRPDLPHAADQVLARGLAKAPADRYPSCGEFAAALRNALGLPSRAPAAVVVVGRPLAQAAQPGAAVAGKDGNARTTAITVPVGLADSTQRPARKWPLGLGQHRAAAALAAVLAAAAVTAAVIWIPGLHSRATPAPARHTSAPLANTAPARQRISIRRIASVTGVAAYASAAYGFSPDSRTLIIEDNNYSVHLWDVATDALTATITHPVRQGQVQPPDVALSPDGKTLAAADATDGTTYLWDVATRTRTATLTDRGGSGAGWAMFSPDGNTLAIADNDGRTYLWDVATRTLTATLTDPRAIGGGPMAFSPDGNTLAIGNNGRTYLWDVATHTLTATLATPLSSEEGGGRPEVGVPLTAFSPDGKTLAIANSTGIYLVDAARGSLIATLADPDTQTVESVAFSPDGKTLTVDDFYGNVYLWDVAARNLVATIAIPGNGPPGPMEPYSPPVLSADGKKLAVVAPGNVSIDLWGIAS